MIPYPYPAGALDARTVRCSCPSMENLRRRRDGDRPLYASDCPMHGEVYEP